MYDAGYENITNMDISDVCIQAMATWNEDRPKMIWEVMDVTQMTYPDEEFDIAIDKSTIDALLCGQDAFLSVAKMTKEVQRILKPEGIYFVVSYGRPESWILHFEWEHLDFKTK
jgi:ubiquinone/menaquinone biosynthesis C-methylase UbiE